MDIWLGLFITLFGLILAGNQYRLNDVNKSQSSETLRLDTRITEELIRLDERLKGINDTLLTDLNQISSRISTRVDQISTDVVFKDVFEQHEKIEEVNAKHNEKMFRLLEKQLENFTKTNTEEIKRLLEKMDKIPQIIKEEIDRSIKNRGIS